MTKLFKWIFSKSIYFKLFRCPRLLATTPAIDIFITWDVPMLLQICHLINYNDSQQHSSIVKICSSTNSINVSDFIESTISVFIIKWGKIEFALCVITVSRLRGCLFFLQPIIVIFSQQCLEFLINRISSAVKQGERKDIRYAHKKSINSLLSDKEPYAGRRLSLVLFCFGVTAGNFSQFISFRFWKRTRKITDRNFLFSGCI